MDVQVYCASGKLGVALADCYSQMPIRDGYSATQAIRREAPWKDIPEVRGVPIVAMTASAIQGDKEKCTLAGMDVSLYGTEFCWGLWNIDISRTTWPNPSRASFSRR